MDFYDVINKRRSYRQFESKTPEADKVERILKAAQKAPTWANFQGVEYIVVKDPENVKALWKAINQKTKFQNAPMFIVGLIDEDNSGKNKNGEKYYPVDFGICFEHLILAATAEGLGTCWIGWFKELKIKEILNIPKRYHVLAISPLGYPKKLKNEVKNRKPIEQIVHYEKF
ncbi:MAG: nitroreductase family protein [Candidatus Lokiarchaeota archaeon]